MLKCKLCGQEGNRDTLREHLKRVHSIRGKNSNATDQRNPISFYITNENSPHKKEPVPYQRLRTKMVKFILKLLGKKDKTIIEKV